MEEQDRNERMVEEAKRRGESSTIDGAYPNEILDSCSINLSMVSAGFRGQEVTITEFSQAATEFGDGDNQCSNTEAKAFLTRLENLGKAEQRGVATYYIEEVEDSEYV